MDADDQEYQNLQKIFQEEAREHIQNLNTGLLQLERSPESAPLAEIVRAAHSLKGASRMMGFPAIESISHSLEGLITQVMEGSLQASAETMNTLYRAVDAISQELTALEEGRDPQSPAEIVEEVPAIEKKAPASGQAPAPQQPATKEPGVTRGGERTALTTVRVETDKLDTLINRAGELLVSKIGILANLKRFEEILEIFHETWRKPFTDPTALFGKADGLGEEFYDDLAESTYRLERLIDDIHQQVRDLRLLPLSTILDPFPRMVRDLSRDTGKDVELITQGTTTRLDKKLLEEIRDPLIHLVRNAIDHGISSPEERSRQGKNPRGKLTIAARQEAGRVIITVGDDGRGLDRKIIERAAVQKGLVAAEEIARWPDEEVWELIFRSGFSTATSVTEISGRGVGMAEVCAKVEGLKGSITIDSRLEAGATFTLSLPLTLSTTNAILFQAGGELFCIATDALEKTLLLSPEQICSVDGRKAVLVDGAPLAFAWLADLLKLAREETAKETIPALLLQSPRGKAVLGVEALLGEEEIVVKGLGDLLSHVPLLSGATILGKDQIALILNPVDLLRHFSRQGEAHGAHHSLPAPAASGAVLPSGRRKVLVVEDSLTTRTLEKNILEAAGFEVTTAVDGEDALIRLYEKNFDLVITDVQMPRLDGLALTERIKKEARFKDIPVILVTSLRTEKDKKRGIEVGADAYITKDTFDEKHLLGVIQRFV